MVERGLNLKPISGWLLKRFYSLYSAFVIGHQRRWIVSSATDWSRMTRLDVFLLLPSTNSLSYFASLEFRLSYTELPLVGLRLEAYGRARNTAFTNSVWSWRRDRSPGFMIVRHRPNSLSTVQDTSIVVDPLHIFDCRTFAEETRGVRFCLVTVVRGQKHVTNVYDGHSDEMSRRVAQAQEGKDPL